MDHRSVALCRDHRKLLHLRCGLSGDPGATPVGMTGCAAVQDELAPHTVCRGWQGPSPAVPWSGSCPWAVVPISDIAEPATVSALTSVSCLSASFLYGGRVLACF
jgi:hypothetical protein